MVQEKKINDVALPMVDILKFSILNRRSYVIEALTEFDKYNGRGKLPNTYIVRASLIALFREVSPSLQKDYEKEEFEKLKTQIFSNDYNSLCLGFDSINLWLYKKGVLFFDTKKLIDTTSTNDEDILHGL